jgi:putative ABC transport system substrate-binding protein
MVMLVIAILVARVSYSRRAPHAKTRRRTIVGTFLTRTFTVEGANIEILYRHWHRRSHELLKGEKPAELPVQQFARFELVANRNAAKWLNIDVPASVLWRADDVID